MAVVLITGCSTGIGAAAARVFAEAGWTTVATMRDPAKAGDLSRLAGVELDRLDVRSLADAGACIERVIARHGALDVLVNNAGFGALASFEATGEELAARMIQTNLIGVMNMTRAVLPVMRNQGRGVIVNVTSVGGLTTMPFNSVYHATKFAVDGFSEGLRFELDPLGIAVKVVAPGGVATPFAHTAISHDGGPEPDAYAAGVGKVRAAFEGRASAQSSPEVVARAIFDAANDGSKRLRYVVGADAEALLAARKSLDEGGYLAALSQRFGLTPAAAAPA